MLLRIVTLCVCLHTMVCCAFAQPSLSVQELKKEFRHLRKEERALSRLNRQSTKRNKQALTKLSQSEQKLIAQNISLQHTSQKDFAAIAMQADKQQQTTSLLKENKDSVFASKRERWQYRIWVKRENITRLKRAQRQQEKTIKAVQVHKLELLKACDLKDPAMLKQYRKMDKDAFYLKKAYTCQKANLLEKLELKDMKKLINEALQNNLRLEQIVRTKGESALPPQYQTQKKVEASLPQNSPGVDDETKRKLTQRMEESMAKFDKMKSGAIDLSDLKDTLTFVPNPYKGLPFMERLTHNVNWQTNQASYYFPAIIDFGLTFGYKWTPKLTPAAGAVYKLGVGNGWEHIAFSYQGFSLRGGMEHHTLKAVSLFAQYEHAWFCKNAKTKTETTTSQKYINMPGVIIGITTHTKIKMMIGYDLLYPFYTYKTSALIFRVGL